ncbi:MAG: sensor domain-containing diguanylate cyclase [Rhodoferax sp.]|nr:sensor domain-containing diguanylate cyclase [Rhodoferax sp.]
MSQQSSLSLQAAPDPRRRRLFAIVWVFAALVVGLFLFASFSIQLLSAGRAYVQGEGLWSKGQKDAIYALSRYTLYGDEEDYQTYLSALAVNQGDRRARLELEKPHPDLKMAYDGLLQGRNHPDDIDGMIFLFRKFRKVPDIDKAISIWTQADHHIEELTDVGMRIRAASSLAVLSPGQVRDFLSELHAINAKLTPLEDEFSFTLGRAARDMTLLILIVMSVVVTVLLVGAFKFSRRMVLQNEAFQDALRRNKNQLRDVLQHAPMPIVITRFADKSVVYMNDHGLAQFKITQDDLAGMRPSDLYANPADRNRIMEALQATGKVQDMEVQLKDARGDSFWVQYSSQRLSYDGEDCLLTALVDIDEKKRAHDDLQYRAYHDVLTGLPNRAMFMDSLKRTRGRMERIHGMFSILFIDLDHFKEVNDALGHDMGDLLLQQVTQRIQSCVRGSDLVARLGGDEFVVLIEAHDDADNALRIAQKIVQTLEAAYDLAGQTARVTASIGISRFPQDGDEIGDLLNFADLAMYQAKDLGKNNVQFYKPEA